MDNIRRIYVEKKPGFDVEAGHALADLRENLNIKSLEGLRILNRYDIEGISDSAYDIAVKTIFSEPPVDMVYEEDFLSEDEAVFAVKYLPGQYDQRADSAEQCIRIVSAEEDQVSVETAKVYVCKGCLSDEDVCRIKDYCINPVDSVETGFQKPKSLRHETKLLQDVETLIGFVDMNDNEIAVLKDELGLAMSVRDLLHCRDYFRSRGCGSTGFKDPTITEIKVIDTYWSDHCRHTTFLTALEHVTFEDGHYADLFRRAWDMYLNERADAENKKDICLMDLAVAGMKALRRKGMLDDLDESEEVNACSVEIEVMVNGGTAACSDGEPQKWLIMFKNETHNHPTEIEPFGGAATCLGGAIRDPLSGRSYVYQAMRVTGGADPRTPVEETLPGKLPQRKITTTAAHGFSSYGNQIGLATGQVAEIFHHGYVAKRMEIGAVVGASPKCNVIRQAPEEGDAVLLVGGRTGRDGCGGATGSSKEHDENSLLTCGAEVQKGNPPTERKLQRLFRNPDVSRIIKRCNDFGAGGVSVAIGELADGLDINLDLVPKKYEGLDGTELAISESQERMAVVVADEDCAEFIRQARLENLEATKVAVVTGDSRLKMSWRGKTIVDISRVFLDTNGARQTAQAVVRSPKRYSLEEGSFAADRVGGKKPEMPDGIRSAWLDNLRDINVASQKGLSERFDSTIGSCTVLMPFGGKNQLTPPDAMAAKIPVRDGETTTATLMAYGCNPLMMEWSCFHGAVCAVVESISKIVATGGDYKRVRLSFQEYFERMTDDAMKWGKPLAALLGAFYAQMMIGIPAIGGKDSMSGTFKELNVPPTLTSFALGVADTGHIISPEFKNAGHTLMRINTPYKDDIPDFEALKKNLELIHRLIVDGKVISASSISYGGTAASVSKMAMGNSIGADIDCNDLFVPRYGSFIVECVLDEAGTEEAFNGINCEIIGKTVDSGTIVVNGVAIEIDEMIAAWLEPLESVFPTGYLRPAQDFGGMDIMPYLNAEGRYASVKIARPRILIPVFPGTNCEYDTQAAFERAGGEADIFVLRNLRQDWLEESLREMGERIKSCQIIALPGGFSAGDEPDGSGKFITSVFRNPYIRESVMDLLNNRDGLMLGICNGFQALLKLGLIMYGEIRDMDKDSPTLTYNSIGRHVSKLARTKIISCKSPWLANCRPGDEHMVAVSHGEGRFVADDGLIRALIRNGQIATQYVDQMGHASDAARFNPNGSMYAIEGMTSPDGRIFGKMCHSERIGMDVYKNVPGEKDQRIFEAGVDYFRE